MNKQTKSSKKAVTVKFMQSCFSLAEGRLLGAWGDGSSGKPEGLSSASTYKLRSQWYMPLISAEVGRFLWA